MDASGNQPSASGSRRSGKKPMQFMFIDSTSHGVNAKPDKAVRSFVMKSARSKKPWSTRQKSPKEADSDLKSPTEPTPSPTGTHGKPGNASPLSAGESWTTDLTHSPDPWSTSSRRSPVSTKSRGQSLSQKATPLSSPGSVCENSLCDGYSCGQTHRRYAPPGSHTGWDLAFLADVDCYPVKMDQKMKSVIHNFATYYTELLIPLDHRNTLKASTMKWVMNGMLSPTGAPFIYAALTSGALNPTPNVTPGDMLSYKTEAIRHIQKLLMNPKTRVDDNNIAAVFMLLCIEEGRASDRAPEAQAQMVAHLNGLKMMMKLRGGLASLEKNQYLQTFILMHSVAHAVVTFQRPYTTLVDANGQVQQYDIRSFRNHPSSAHTLRLFGSLELDSTLFDITANAIAYVGDVATASENPRSSLNPLDLQKHASLLLYRLLDWYKLGEEDALSERNPLDQSICLALMISIIMAANTSPTDEFMVLTAGHKLRSALTKCLFRWARAPDLFIWTLLMGALATCPAQQPTPDFAFFKEYCGLAFADQEFNESSNPEEILDRMRSRIWLPKLDKKVKKLLVIMGLCLAEEVVETVEFAENGVSEDAAWDVDAVGKEHVVGGLTNGRFFGKRSESLETR